MTWIEAGTLDKIRTRPLIVKHGVRQLVVLAAGGSFRAIDNRCPHEGYPLSQGTLDPSGEVLTCQWHNWKFRLADGACVLGGDDVRAYPTKIEHDKLWVDVSEPPLEETRRRVLSGLETAFREDDFGRIARELARLGAAGIDPDLAIVEALRWGHDRWEYGTTHAVAAAADWLALAHELADQPAQALACRAEAVEHVAFDSLRHPSYPFAAAADGYREAELLAAIEREDREAAEAQVAAALAAGRGWRDLEGPLARAALAHYLDFGHALIYLQKTGELIALLGEGVEPLLIPPLVRTIVYATREDLLPDFRAYRATVDALSLGPDQPEAARLPFPLAMDAAFAATRRLAAEAGPLATWDRLLEAGARNLLHFDASYQYASDRPVADNVGYLDFTHALTFADALRDLATRHPELWPAGLTQMACFIGRNRPYLDPARTWARLPDADAFWRETRDRLLDHGTRTPLFAAHVVKTFVAARKLAAVASPPTRDAVLAALARFLSARIKEKHPLRMARQAMTLVGEGA